MVYVTISQNIVQTFYIRSFVPSQTAFPYLPWASIIKPQHVTPVSRADLFCFTTSFSHMLQATGGWWQCVGCGTDKCPACPNLPLVWNRQTPRRLWHWSWRDCWEGGRVCSSRVGSGGQQVPSDPQCCVTLLLMSLFLFLFSLKGGRLASPFRPLELALSRGSLAPGSPLTWSFFRQGTSSPIP